MNVYHSKGSKEPSEIPNQNLKQFANDLIDLSNKYRIAVVLGNIMILKDYPVEGKLLDVAAYSYDAESKLSYPVFVDRLSKYDDETPETEERDEPPIIPDGDDDYGEDTDDS